LKILVKIKTSHNLNTIHRNMLREQSRRADKGWSSSEYLAEGRGSTDR